MGKAVQQALEAENALKRVEFEAQQAITRAEAEAKGLELQRAQITSDLLELRRIEVQGRAIDKWNGVMPTVVTGGGPVPILDVWSQKCNCVFQRVRSASVPAVVSVYSIVVRPAF